MDEIDGLVWRFPGLCLAAFQVQMVDFVIGASAWIGFPTRIIHYDSDRWYRCLNLHLGAMFFFIELNIPLWFEYEAGEPIGEKK